MVPRPDLMQMNPHLEFRGDLFDQLAEVHTRFGDPVTLRTYWTDEPMVLFSHPDSVREIFRLDPAIAPAGRSSFSTTRWPPSWGSSPAATRAG